MEQTNRILLSARPFWGESVVARSQNPQLVERFHEGRATLELLRAARRAEIGGLVTTNDSRVLAALRELGSDHPRVVPIIPNVIGYVRESTHYGMVGAGWRRLKSLGLMDLLRIGARGLVRAPKVLSRHFPSILEILLEVEMADFRRFCPQVVFLHPVTTDLALALDNRSLFQLYHDRMTEHFGCEPGLATNNFGTLVPRVQEWDLDFRHLLAPFNDRGYGMLPNQQQCEQLRSASSIQLTADRVAVGGLPTRVQFEYLRQVGAQSGVVDVTSTEELDRVQAAAQGLFQ